MRSKSWAIGWTAIVSYQNDSSELKKIRKKQEGNLPNIYLSVADKKEQILDKPEVLGVDDFGSRGVIIRVWIKTQPLKQWNVAREFRRRLKVALDKAEISIPMPQQEVWFNNSLPLKSSLNSSSSPR